MFIDGSSKCSLSSLFHLIDHCILPDLHNMAYVELFGKHFDKTWDQVQVVILTHCFICIYQSGKDCILRRRVTS